MSIKRALVTAFAASFLGNAIAMDDSAACAHPAIEARVAKMNAQRAARDVTTIPVDSPLVQDIPTALSTVTVTTTEIDTLTVTLAGTSLTTPCETTITETTFAGTVTETTTSNGGMGGNITALSVGSGYTYSGAGTGTAVSSLTTITLTSTESGTLTRTDTFVVVSTINGGSNTTFTPVSPTPISWGPKSSATTDDSDYSTSAVDAITATPTPSTLSTSTHSYTSTSASSSVTEPAPTSGAAAGEVNLASSVLLAAVAGLIIFAPQHQQQGVVLSFIISYQQTYEHGDLHPLPCIVYMQRFPSLHLIDDGDKAWWGSNDDLA
ncbi:hypothetical protein B0H67DRAFT_644607 [Lasiosphaeris hirsuta]|uniref:Uncharacterized protein n=1 Tax=Lasiosphaeris hirsuta TaxID=260670 RepID=A0AA40AF91_9PEZI|nr:hypothetical protein B0H67DRAFT_644607 [Lasiosphaeris hirsuta]